MTKPAEVAQRLGLPELAHVEQAFTHPSYANEQRRGPKIDYQRLEFLGDAVLGLCVSEDLLRRFPEASEGELSLLRSSIVSTSALAEWARVVDLAPAIRMGRGADAAGERQRSNVLADVVESLVAAVYLDTGLDKVRELADRIVEVGLAARGARPLRDPKSELQELVQARGEPTPRYRVLRAAGPEHRRTYVVAVEIGEAVLGEGEGLSKKDAERAAAKAALARITGDVIADAGEFGAMGIDGGGVDGRDSLGDGPQHEQVQLAEGPPSAPAEPTGERVVEVSPAKGEDP